jgi:hypothetical protein
MTADDAAPSGPPRPDPATFLAAAAALESIQAALRTAGDVAAGEGGERREGRDGAKGEAGGPPVGRDQALASLLLLREVRERLAGWETGLIETARAAGASWADLAGPLGVASRQAAERRYLRLRPGEEGSTGEERVRATRDSRAADRSVSAWARENAGELRLLAGEIAALTDLPPAARPGLRDLRDALAHDDAARLVAPLTATAPHLPARHPALAARLDTVTRRADRLRATTASARNRPT